MRLVRNRRHRPQGATMAGQPERNCISANPRMGPVRELLKLDGVDCEVEEEAACPIGLCTYC